MLLKRYFGLEITAIERDVLGLINCLCVWCAVYTLYFSFGDKFLDSRDFFLS